MEYIISLKKKNGMRIGYSQNNTSQTAVRHLFREYNVPYLPLLKEELCILFKGLKRQIASDVQDGIIDIRIGKDPFEFSIYKILIEMLPTSGSKDCSFAHCELVLSWNLMSRVSNGLGMKFGHLEWENDSMVIYFRQMNNAQFGEKKIQNTFFQIQSCLKFAQY
jgi:hypothetical protein